MILQKTNFIVYLDSLGLSPTNVKVQAKAGEAQEERLVYPGALVSYQGREIAIDLLKGTKRIRRNKFFE